MASAAFLSETSCSLLSLATNDAKLTVDCAETVVVIGMLVVAAAEEAVFTKPVVVVEVGRVSDTLGPGSVMVVSRVMGSVELLCFKIVVTVFPSAVDALEFTRGKPVTGGLTYSVGLVRTTVEEELTIAGGRPGQFT